MTLKIYEKSQKSHRLFDNMLNFKKDYQRGSINQELLLFWNTEIH